MRWSRTKCGSARRPGSRKRSPRRDRALVASYTSEAEIDLARNRALQTINTSVQSSLAYSEQLNKRKAEAEAKKAELQGKPMAATLERELESIDAELARQADLVAQKKREVALITAKYDADKQRWRELVAAKAVSDSAKAANAATGTAVDRGASRRGRADEVTLVRPAAAPAAQACTGLPCAVAVRPAAAPACDNYGSARVCSNAGDPWLSTCTR